MVRPAGSVLPPSIPPHDGYYYSICSSSDWKSLIDECKDLPPGPLFHGSIGRYLGITFTETTLDIDDELTTRAISNWYLASKDERPEFRKIEGTNLAQMSRRRRS